jgi:hypothetical protein
VNDYGSYNGARAIALTVVLIGMTIAWPGRATAQIVNPADAQKPDAAQEQTPARTHTWDMPPVDVYGNAPIAEEDLIGDYGQPRWTAHRRFGETRVYVMPKGMVEFEYWLRPEVAKDGPTQFSSMYEVGFGLPGRLQLDLYAVANKTGPEGTLSVDQQKVEVRYAFADWNRIPGNPTLYLEWTQNSGGPDAVEGKLLFGGQLTSRWHWGSNLVFEHEISGAQENSHEWTTGLSYTARDMKVGVGVETQLALVNSLDDHGARGPMTTAFLVGPSLQFRPLPQMHLDIAPLLGLNHDAPRTKWFVVLGYEF